MIIEEKFEIWLSIQSDKRIAEQHARVSQTFLFCDPILNLRDFGTFSKFAGHLDEIS